MVTRTAFLVDGSQGGQFLIEADGSFLFQPGRDFDALSGFETTVTDLSFTIGTGRGRTTEGSASVVVRASDLAPSIETAVPALDVPEMTRTTVSGSFDQTQGVDVLSEMFKRLDDSTDFDLDSLLDFQVLDVDMLMQASFVPENGVSVTFEDLNPGSDALIGDLGAILSPAAEAVTDVVNLGFALPIQPFYFGPTFDVAFGISANLGWDIDLPSLGKTAIFQPVDFGLMLPDEAIAPGQAFVISTEDMVSYDPTVAVQTVGLRDIQVDAGFGMTSAVISDVGLTFGTGDFLGLNADGLLEGSVMLNREFNLVEMLGAEAIEGAMSLDFSLSMKDIIDAVYAQDLPEFFRLVTALINEPGTDTAKALGTYIMDGIQLVIANAGKRLVVGSGVELKPSQLLELVDRVPFNEFDGWDEVTGEGYFLATNGDGAEVRLSASQIRIAYENNEISGAMEDITALLEEGFEPITGFKISGAMPIGNIETVEGFGTGVSGPQEGEQQIEVVQTTRLAGMSVDFEAMAPELMKIAIDIAAEAGVEAAKSQPYLIPVVIGAQIAARAALEAQVDAMYAAESGYTLNMQAQPTEMVAAAINPFVEGLNATARLVNSVLSVLPSLDPSVRIATLDLLTPEQMESDLDGAIDTMVAGIQDQLVALTTVAGDILTGMADNDIAQAAAAGLGQAASLYLGSALGTLAGWAGKIDQYLHVGLSPVINVLNAAASLVNAGANGAAQLDQAMVSLASAAAGLASQLGDTLEGFGQFVKDIAKGVELEYTTDFDFFEMVLDAGIDLVQIARFDPDEVEVSYSVDGFTSEQKIGDPAEFFASGEPGDLLDGQASYSFSGDVDYEYRIKLDIAPMLSMLGYDVEGKVTIGDDNSFDVAFDYGALKTTTDFTLDDIANLDPRDLFDDALVELPLGLFENVMEVIADQLRTSLGSLAEDTGQTTDLDWNELRLFKVNDVEITKDQFTEITQEFQIAVGGAEPTPVAHVRFDESGALAVSPLGIMDGIDGTLATVGGAVLNIGQYLDVLGGQLLVDRDGQVAFADGTENEHLAVGDSVSQVVRFTVDGPDGTPQLHAFTVTVEGTNDAPVALADSAQTTEDSGAVLIDVLANDTDVDDGAVLSLVGGQSTAGTVAVVDGLLAFTPAADFFGAAQVDYVVADEHGAQATGQLTVTVAPAPDDVRPADDTATTREDRAVTIDVRANDTEVDGEAISVLSVEQPARGLVSLLDDGRLSFDPNGDFDALRRGQTAEVSFVVTVTDGTGTPQQETVTVTVEGSNFPSFFGNRPVWQIEPSTLLGSDGDDVFTLKDASRDGRAVTFDGGLGDDSVVVDGRRAEVDLTDAQFIGIETLDVKGGTIHVDRDGSLDLSSVGAVINASRIFGSGGDEVLIGHAGDDVFDGGRGADTLIGGDGDDTFVLGRGEAAGDVIDGGAGYDVVRASADVRGASLRNIELLDAGGAKLTTDASGLLDMSGVESIANASGLGGADVLDGQGGDDVFVLGGQTMAGTQIIGGDGLDTVQLGRPGGRTDVTGASFDGVEVLDGQGGTLLFNGSFDAGQFQELRDAAFVGGAGDDTLPLGQDGTAFDGRNGTDTLVLAGSVRDYVISGNDNRATVTGPNGAVYSLRNVEKLAFDDYTWSLDGVNNGPMTADDVAASAVAEGETLVIDAADLLANDSDPQNRDFALSGVTADGGWRCSWRTARSRSIPLGRGWTRWRWAKAASRR